MLTSTHDIERPNLHAYVLGDLVNVLRRHYVIGDTLEPDGARDVVSAVIYDMLSNVYAVHVRNLEDCSMSDAVRPLDSSDTFAITMGMIIRSHRRSFQAVADCIVQRLLAVSRNRIFLDTSEIKTLLAVSSAVGLEIERVIPETAIALLREIEQ